MPEIPSPAETVLESLGLALFLRDPSGTLRLAGSAPEWLRDLWPALKQNDASLPIEDASPFLENFLLDAEACWEIGGSDQTKSGPWIEQAAGGGELQLEATAMTAAGRAVLLIERLGEAFEAKKSVLQKARENVIAQQRLNSEIQKKEILLHCIADEMTAALANVITSLRLIELEDNGPRTKLLLGLATRGTQEQQTLINRVLDVFAEELRGAHADGGISPAIADSMTVLHHALEFVSSQFSEKKVRLETKNEASPKIGIPGNEAQLERVMVNLLENALERAPAGTEVVVGCVEEGETLLVSVDDHGVPLPAENCEDIFAKWEPAPGEAQTASLRLHFCRLMVENCGGEVGCMQRPGGENRFWIRLPKVRPPE